MRIGRTFGLLAWIKLVVAPAVVLVPITTLSGPSQTGLVIEKKSKQIFRDSVNRVKEIHKTEIVKIKGSLVKIYDATFKKAIIVRPDKKLCWVLDMLDQRFSQVTFEEISKYHKELVSEIKMAKDRVKGSSDEKDLDTILIGYREFEKINAEVKESGNVQKILNKDCKEKNVLVNKEFSDFTGFVDESIPEYVYYFESLALVGGFKQEVFKAMNKLKGFPIKGTMRYILFEDRVESKDEVIKIERVAIDDKEFEIPEGFLRVPLVPVQKWQPRSIKKPAKFKEEFTEDDIEEKSLPFTPNE